MRISARLKYIGLAILFVISTLNFSYTVKDVIRSSKRLEDSKNDLSLLQQQKDDLEQNIAYKKTPEFIEQKARDELGLVKPGESVYVVNGVDLNKTNVLAATTKRTQGSMINTLDWKKNMKSWFDLFF